MELPILRLTGPLRTFRQEAIHQEHPPIKLHIISVWVAAGIRGVSQI